VPLHSAPMVRAGALSAQNTGRTHSGGCLIFDGSAKGMHAARLKDLTGGTAIKVVRWSVGKNFIAKNASLACMLGFAQRISHVRGDAENWIFGAVLLGTILNCVPALANQPGSEAPRLLEPYETEGPYSLDRSSRHQEDRFAVEARIRDFLWTRWHRGKLAYLIVVQYTLEGLATRTWYFVEPSQEHTWHIVVEEDATLPGTDPKTEMHYHKRARYEVSTVERIEIASYDASARQIIGADEMRSPDTYKLRLRAKNGEVVSEL
jgi:hypothetical protein